MGTCIQSGLFFLIFSVSIVIPLSDFLEMYTCYRVKIYFFYKGFSYNLFYHSTKYRLFFCYLCFIILCLLFFDNSIFPVVSISLLFS